MSKLKNLLEQMEITNRHYSLFKKKDVMVLGVSGGPDSVALLMLLEMLKKRYQWQLHVAHLNHGLMARESKSYEALVRRMAKKLALPFYSRAIRLKTLAKRNKRSIEEMGRIERYRFFEEVARKTGANKIVTAHTLDDQAETMMLRLLRGSGLKGLRGIPYKRNQGSYTVIRPLLSCQKRELLIFLKENKMPFMKDKTNRDKLFTRNRVRHELLPLLERSYNPNIRKSLASLQSVCAQAQDYIERASLRALDRCRIRRNDGARKMILRIEPLRKLHPAIAREVLLRGLEWVRGDLKKISHYHIEAMMDILSSDEDNLECHLPDHVVVLKNGSVLEFTPQRE